MNLPIFPPRIPIDAPLTGLAAELAIHGGPCAVSRRLPAWPPGWPSVREAFEAAWADGSWGKYHGSHSGRLLAALCELHDVRHAALCCSGTFAVELALRSLGIGRNDEVVLAGYDFPGNFRAVEAVGARPVLVDLAHDRWTVAPESLLEASGPAVRAWLVSHLHGDLAPMPRIMDLARERGVVVVEDACQVTGALLANRRCGAWGDVGVLSFGGSKLLSAGRGGAILTSREDCLQRAKLVCERGNHAFPLSELQAALIVPQIESLDDCNRRRLAAINRLQKRLAGIAGITSIEPAADVLPAYYKFGLWIDANVLGARERFIDALQAEGVPIDAGFRGFTLRGGRRCRTVGSLTNAARAAADTLVLHHPLLLGDEELIDEGAMAIHKVVAAFQRQSQAAAKRNQTQ